MTFDFNNFENFFDEDFTSEFRKTTSISSKMNKSNLDVLSRLKINLTKKSIWIYILRLLSHKRPLYGYEIQTAIQEEFDLDTLSMSQVSCYKELYRMSQQGLVVSKISDSTTRKRRYYFITEQGLTVLKEAAQFLKHTYESLFGHDPLDQDLI
ncbi:MAG: PadR family transcriptional regulator [Candidatus Thorarchaeota archaeon]